MSLTLTTPTTTATTTKSNMNDTRNEYFLLLFSFGIPFLCILTAALGARVRLFYFHVLLLSKSWSFHFTFQYKSKLCGDVDCELEMSGFHFNQLEQLRWSLRMRDVLIKWANFCWMIDLHNSFDLFWGKKRFRRKIHFIFSKWCCYPIRHWDFILWPNIFSLESYFCWLPFNEPSSKIAHSISCIYTSSTWA